MLKLGPKISKRRKIITTMWIEINKKLKLRAAKHNDLILLVKLETTKKLKKARLNNVPYDACF